MIEDWIAGLAGRYLTGDDAAAAGRLYPLLAGGGADAAAACLDLARLAGEAVPAAEIAEEIAARPTLSGRAETLAAVLCLVMAAYAAVHADYESRSDAVSARRALTAAADAAYGTVAADFGADALRWITGIVSAAAVALSRTAADRAPLVRVETQVSMPSSLVAFDLYGDAGRGGEIVRRNRAATPAVLPTRMEALAR